MPRKRRRRSGGGSRRKFLLVLGSAATVIGLGGENIATGAFSSVNAQRTGNFSVASADNAMVGVVGQGTVKKNSREPMVKFENNRPAALDITVSLDTCSDGTLYDNDGESGCSVTFNVMSGNEQYVDIDAAVTGTIPYSVSISGSNFSLDTSGSVDAESGNVKGVVRIKKPTKDNEFSARRNKDEWETKVFVEDNDGDGDLDRIELEVTEGESGGTVVASKTITLGGTFDYKNNKETIQPDDSKYNVAKGQLYTLTVTAYDADGNFSTATVQDTA
ncbi:hypothetical protein [Halobellus marinus]|uniref:hypothetical protein n=1 Tax=Halobellus TaxID=1073986 RepID=UPI0028AF5A06|nr:hypothetical protein [Halobellus sp. DFY28]